MTAFFGSTPITGIKFGDVDIVRVMFGDIPVWSPGTRADFNIDDQVGLPAPWTRHGPGTSDTYQAMVRDGYVRMNVPQFLDLAGVLAPQRDEWRYGGSTLAADDGYIKTQLATAGSQDPTFGSKVFAKVSNATAAGSQLTNAVGMAFAGRTARITRRIGGTNTDVKCGSYADGDVFELHFEGNVYTLFRGTKDVGQWTDTGYTVTTGAGNRSMALSVMGGKPSPFTPRQFSVGLDYIEMGVLAA